MINIGNKCQASPVNQSPEVRFIIPPVKMGICLLSGTWDALCVPMVGSIVRRHESEKTKGVRGQACSHPKYSSSHLKKTTDFFEHADGQHFKSSAQRPCG